MQQPLHGDTAALLRDADRCVMCGLCSAHCPTYGLHRHEAESPRGRIALIQALLRGDLDAEPGLVSHFDNCLGCRSCEQVCPSGVPYGRLMDATRSHIESAVRHRGTSFLAAVVRRKFLLRGVGYAARWYQWSGLRRLARWLGIPSWLGLRRWEQLLPTVPRQRRWRSYYAPLGDVKGDVALFTGCVASIFDTSTQEAAVRVLRRCGYGVCIPPQQSCCGAMHLHGGDAATAAALAAVNISAFARHEGMEVLSTASGCGAALAEYGHTPGLAEDRRDAACALAARHEDISAFLAREPGLKNLTFRPLPKRVALHNPCTLRNVLKAEAHPAALLGLIPGLEIVSLPDMPRCCGAAGTHMLSHADTADALRDELLADLEGVELLLTSNIGCAMHISAGLRDKGLDMEVVHPLVLLARQLEEG